MERRFRRKIWRLEKQISEVKTREKEEWNDFFLTHFAGYHAAKVAAIVLHGEPKIEPLIRALRRACEKFGFSRYHQENAESPEIEDLIRITLTNGKDEAETFSAAFKQAPLWLLHFTTVSLDAFILKLNLPELSAPVKWGSEGIKDARRWPLLPLGTMAAGEPVSEQIVFEPRRLSATDCKFIMHYHPEEGSAEWDRHDKIWTRLHKPKG
jgi:hypothetical protein